MLAAKNICKIYTKQKHPVLDGISLEVSRGTIVGIAGQNGSGKSTLLTILAGLLKPTGGGVSLDGENVLGAKASVRQKIGFMPQDSTLFDELSVRDNINFWAAAYNKKHEPIFFEGEDLRKKAKQLSGGMRKRLNLELSLISSPEFLIMDEPTSALDIVYQQQIMDIMKDLRSKSTGIIFTSHYADELWHCDEIGVIERGVFAYYGKPEEFSDREDFKSKLYSVINRS